MAMLTVMVAASVLLLSGKQLAAGLPRGGAKRTNKGPKAIPLSGLAAGLTA